MSTINPNDHRDDTTLSMTATEFWTAVLYSVIYVAVFNYVSSHHLLPSLVLALISLPGMAIIWTRHWTRRMGFGWFSGTLWPMKRPPESKVSDVVSQARPDRDATKVLDVRELKTWTVDDWESYYAQLERSKKQ